MRRTRWAARLAMIGLVATGACAKAGPETDPTAGDDDESPFEPWEDVLEDTEAKTGFRLRRRMAPRGAGGRSRRAAGGISLEDRERRHPVS